VLDPPPARPGGPPLLIGSVGPRMLEIALPHVDAWNVWWMDYGNTVAGFAAVRERVEEACRRLGRPPEDVAATAAVYVGGDYPGGEVTPVRGSPGDIAAHLAAMSGAGAAHLQLVVDPITVGTIEVLGEVLAEFD
jgi:alkanesulfonate monooxygenase SsuD/methylene tetrahydromethanopterin reductase-like flavin-dependent oxidoreductase (luciferase family)